MKCPSYLGDHAKAFYRDHSTLLREMGVLNPLTQTMFLTLCETFQDYKNAEEDTLKLKFLDRLTALSAKFGLVPHAAQTREAIAKQEDNAPDDLDKLISS